MQRNVIQRGGLEHASLSTHSSTVSSHSSRTQGSCTVSSCLSGIVNNSLSSSRDGIPNNLPFTWALSWFQWSLERYRAQLVFKHQWSQASEPFWRVRVRPITYKCTRAFWWTGALTPHELHCFGRGTGPDFLLHERRVKEPSV